MLQHCDYSTFLSTLCSESVRDVAWCSQDSCIPCILCKPEFRYLILVSSIYRAKYTNIQITNKFTSIFMIYFIHNILTNKFLDTKAPCTLVWPYTEGTWLYCDYFIWCVSCTVVVLTVWVCVLVFWQSCGYFGNVRTCIYCVLYCLYCVFVLFRLCIFILICFVCTSVRTTATEWQLNWNNNNNNNNNKRERHTRKPWR